MACTKTVDLSDQHVQKKYCVGYFEIEHVSMASRPVSMLHYSVHFDQPMSAGLFVVYVIRINLNYLHLCYTSPCSYTVSDNQSCPTLLLYACLFISKYR